MVFECVTITILKRKERVIINFLIIIQRKDMLHFYKNTKLYAVAPAGVVTGGSELLHQLVDLINKNGKEAHIVYYGDKKHEVPFDYLKYDVKMADHYEDSAENIVLLYEGNFDRIREIKKAQIFLWWLSVDLMYKSSTTFLSLKDLYAFDKFLGIDTFVRRCYRLVFKKKNQFRNNLSLKEIKKINCVNGYQATYIQQHLYSRGFSQLISLTDYINTDFITNNSVDSKENIILFNPRKGIKFTKKVIEANKDLKFVPIQGLSRKGVVELLSKAKIYIDFGYHPGKDRIPREAALSGCVVITGRNGSAYYFEDVAISDEYKFDAVDSNIPKIGEKIRYCLDNYKDAYKDMEYYCRKIKQEKENFENEVKNFIAL